MPEGESTAECVAALTAQLEGPLAPEERDASLRDLVELYDVVKADGDTRDAQRVRRAFPVAGFRLASRGAIK